MEPAQAAGKDVEHSGVLRQNPTCGAGLRWRVSDGTRTRDRLDHNQELYLLSYAHHGTLGM